MKHHILLVEDSSYAAAVISQALTKSGEFHVTSVGSLREARDTLAKARCDGILLDLNLPDSAGVETFVRIQQNAAGSPVIILTAEQDDAIALAAIALGAAEFLVKGELSAEHLPRRVRLVLERCRVASETAPSQPGRIYVVVGAKGGVGTSTTALNLATTFSQRGKNAAVVELRRTAGSVATMVKTSSALTLDTLIAANGSHPLDSRSGRLPFGPRLFAAPEGIPDTTWAPEAVGAFLEKVASTADYVIVDATPLEPELLQVAVTRAWFTILITEREPLCVQLAARLAANISNTVKQSQALGIVPVTHIPSIDPVPLDTIRQQVNCCGIVSALPPAREILQSYRRHGPIVLACPEAPISVALHDLAARLDSDPVTFLL
jgi:DNA-binding response OmpR family regulator